MKNCILAAGVALGGSAILCGCGGDEDTTAAPVPAPATTTAPSPAPYNPASVEELWANHFNAFATFDVDKIMLDYDETSRISVFNDECAGGGPTGNGTMAVSGLTEYLGTTKIRGFFDALFVQLGKNLTNVVKVGPLHFGTELAEPSVKNDPHGNVFLTWASENMGEKDILKATDSFSFRKDGNGMLKIWQQNIVTTEPNMNCNSFGDLPVEVDGPVKRGWDNHFAAFGAFNDTLIMDDYTATSVVQVWDNVKNTYNVHTGLTQIKTMFVELFDAIKAAGTGTGDQIDYGITTPLVSVNAAYRDVFLVWTSNSHPKATDTFAFDMDGKIVRQNIVVETPSQTRAAQVMV